MARYSVDRVLGDRPFAQIGRPSVAERSDDHGVVVVGGSLGALQWQGRDAGAVRRYRIGVFDLVGLRCRALADSRWPVNAVALHPELPLAAVGTGCYDGGYSFEGELLLVDLATGESVPLLEGCREVRSVRWRDARVLEAVLAPYDDYEDDAAHRVGHAVAIACEDWTAARPRMVPPGRQTGPRVPCARPEEGPAAEALLAALCSAHGEEWTPRRQVWAVEVLPDGRTVAVLDGVRAECRLPSGEVQWSLPDPDGGRQLLLAPDRRSAWVTTPRRARWLPGEGWRARPALVERLSLEDGRTLAAVEPAAPAVLAASRDGRLAARDSDHGEKSPRVRLLAPDSGAELDSLGVGRYDLFNHWFDVRDCPELLFLVGGGRHGVAGKEVAALDPERRRMRLLFPLEWDRTRRGHLFGGPGVHLDEDGGGAALVHAGAVHDGAGLLPGNAFVVRRRLPDGEATWVFTADRHVLAVAADPEHVYAGIADGELVVLDRHDGSVRHRGRLTVDGLPVVPLSLAAPGGGRLLVGTTDGRILDGRILDGPLGSE
ncbi:hypothetical protein [Kitasatospora terrestris]|uniref:Uncharacterized protein n=1 Tax=Kitasatospora terrestris TaxID=258051 RepID=A0ABP9EIV4_9ACTN